MTTNNLPTNDCQPTGSGEHAEGLAAQWHDTLHDATRHHSKLFVLAFRMALPPGLSVPPSGPPIEELLDILSERLREKRLDPVHMCIEQQADGAVPVRHVVILTLDGQRTQSAAGHLRLADTIWSQLLGVIPTGELVLPCLCEDGSAGRQIRRDRPNLEEQIVACYRWGCRLIGSHINQKPGVSL